MERRNLERLILELAAFSTEETYEKINDIHIGLEQYEQYPKIMALLSNK